MKKEISRRRFLRGGAVTGAGLAAYGGISFITDPGRVFGANDRVRFGLIGCGDRGQEDLRAALACTNVECVALADVYTRRLDECKAIASGAKTYGDFRGMLDDKSVDAVVIVTPQHQHVLNFVPALEAGKDVYQEKTMAFNTGHARRMRKQIEFVDQFIAFELVLAAEGIRVRTLLDLIALEAVGLESSAAGGARLIDDAADGGDEDLAAAVEDHGRLRQRNAGGPAQFFIDGGK